MRVSKLGNYLGYFMVTAIWLCFITSMLIHSPDLSEPISQYGYYPDTRWLFALSFIGFGALYYLFSRQLDKYWRYTSICSLLGSMFFALTGIVPYEPYAHRFVFDIHNMSVTLAALFYTLPMLFISYSSDHKRIARSSRYAFVTIFVLVIISFVARIYDLGIFYFQLVAVIPLHIWIVTTNTLVIQHERSKSSAGL